MPSMKKVSSIFLATVGVAVIGGTEPAYADGIDVLPYLLRVGWAWSPAGILAGVLALMGVNYLLNLAIIGWPAVRWGGADLRAVARDLVALTLLGQVADRLGAVLALPLGSAIATALNLLSGGSWVWPLLAMNFILSGTAVGALALYFLRRRWRLARGTSWAIAIAAAILTNPAWAIGLLFVGY